MEVKKTAKPFSRPARLMNDEGKIRKAGFELEFAGIPLKKVVDIVVGLFGGNPGNDDPFYQKITESRYGDFNVELDAHFFKKRLYKKYLQKIGIEITNFIDEKELEEFLSNAASLIVPTEVVTPPIPFDKIDIVEDLKNVLYENQAKGTGDSLLYAFGLHINPEVPSLKANVLLNYLRAFLLLYEWIMKEADIDLTRRITPYISPFPEEYITNVLAADYYPNIDKLMKDYLHYNPTRNRPLDFTPLFAIIDENLVADNIKEQELVKKRPAFHYRLPNCLVDQPDWSIADEWNIWCQIEHLADDQEKIAAMSREYLETKDSYLNLFANEWPEKTRKWLT